MTARAPFPGRCVRLSPVESIRLPPLENRHLATSLVILKSVCWCVH
jgi:hypothetical protein